MEDLQRNLKKQVDSLSHKNHSLKKARKWTILLVNDHGKVISFHRFKGAIILYASMLFVAVIAAIILFFLYNKTQSNNKKLQAMLSTSQAKADSLKNENEILMARVVTSAYKVNTNSATKHEILTEKSSAKKNSNTTDINTTDINATDTNAHNQSSKEQTDKNQVLPAVLSVYDFNTYYNKNKKVLSIKFTIKKMTLKSKIDGYTFVILKNDKTSQNEWLTLPSKNLTEDKPSRKKGQYFLISNFKQIRLKHTNVTNPNQFNKATVFVFSKEEKLLLEKDFTLSIKNKT